MAALADPPPWCSSTPRRPRPPARDTAASRSASGRRLRLGAVHTSVTPQPPRLELQRHTAPLQPSWFRGRLSIPTHGQASIGMPQGSQVGRALARHRAGSGRHLPDREVRRGARVRGVRVGRDDPGDLDPDALISDLVLVRVLERQHDRRGHARAELTLGNAGDPHLVAPVQLQRAVRPRGIVLDERKPVGEVPPARPARAALRAAAAGTASSPTNIPAVRGRRM